MTPHISIKSEKIGEIFGFPLTNSFLTTEIALLFFFIYALFSKRFIFSTRFLINSLYSLFSSIMKEKIRLFFPLLASFFLFILLSNWFGLLPGIGSLLYRRQDKMVPLFRGATADLNTTLALALLAFFLIQYYGMKYLGPVTYLKKFINLTNPITIFTGILELISEVSKIISFAFRLFGNIFAGEVLLMVIAFLIPVLASFPFLILEVFVGLIQALVFSMLLAVFLNMAIVKEH